ncbi:YhcH/YjgK/YiaL family protein [Propionivibrio soli]|uniref:YhcH/YjgK/YiaL family protein n=1 Tax=Propionivibrio soli TaxID=2976531 RepID=UPI0021E9A959|nr:YhcH/YjgK/YiaL family protein [Propionivibrio soli]
MIVGLLSDVGAQKSALPAAIVRALEKLSSVDLRKAEPGRYEIEGDKLFYLVQDVELRTVEQSRAEAHVEYADIQIPVSTAERYGFALPQPLAPTDDQLATKDLAFYPTPANESFVDTVPGTYLVFMPKELHRPCLSLGKIETIRKVVVKVHRSLLGL